MLHAHMIMIGKCLTSTNELLEKYSMSVEKMCTNIFALRARRAFYDREVSCGPPACPQVCPVLSCKGSGVWILSFFCMANLKWSKTNCWMLLIKIYLVGWQSKTFLTADNSLLICSHLLWNKEKAQRVNPKFCHYIKWDVRVILSKHCYGLSHFLWEY